MRAERWAGGGDIDRCRAEIQSACRPGMVSWAHQGTLQRHERHLCSVSNMGKAKESGTDREHSLQVRHPQRPAASSLASLQPRNRRPCPRLGSPFSVWHDRWSMTKLTIHHPMFRHCDLGPSSPGRILRLAADQYAYGSSHRAGTTRGISRKVRGRETRMRRAG